MVYCDIPYEKTIGYGETDFDHKEFYKWCKTRPYQVFFSSYEITEDGFYKVLVEKIDGLMITKDGTRNKVNEYIYSNKEIKK